MSTQNQVLSLWGMRSFRMMVAEHVTDGHPDKICDQIADTIVTEALVQDPDSHVAAEVTGGHGMVFITGEITSSASLDLRGIARRIYKDIGHMDDIHVFTHVVQQSVNIARGVRQTSEHEQGAGDQGIMTGYAVNETPELMPLEWVISRDLCRRLKEVRLTGLIPYLRPDGKSQVTIEDGRVIHVTMACHHASGIQQASIKEDIIRHVVRHILPDLDGTTVVVNGTGAFEIGGFEADSGTTGRKLVVDNYGPRVEIGGGAYSGKDPSKVDRSAAYCCRWVAKSVVANGLAEEALVKLAYAIGVAEPTHFSIQTNRGHGHDAELAEMIRQKICFKPRAIIERLNLTDMSNGWTYLDAAAFGHYGRDAFPWEVVIDLS